MGPPSEPVPLGIGAGSQGARERGSQGARLGLGALPGDGHNNEVCTPYCTELRTVMPVPLTQLVH